MKAVLRRCGVPIAFALGLLACWLPPAGAEIAVIDDAGQPVVVAAPARRIVSLAPHVTELLFAAGAGAAVIGVSEYSDYPARARDLPRVGGGGGLDLERILALRPDLVVAWGSGNSTFQVQRLRELGLTVFVSEPRDLDAIAYTLERLAALAGTLPAARAAIDAYEQRLAGLRTAFHDRSPVDVFYQIWDRPPMTVSGAHLVSDVLRLCGGRNVFADLPSLASSIGIEAVLQRDPRVIVVAAGPGEAGRLLAPWRRWPQLSAVRGNHLYAIERELLVRHTPRILDGAEQLCRLLDKARAGGQQGAQ